MSHKWDIEYAVLYGVIPMMGKALSRTLRQRHYYPVPSAGAKIGLKRTQSYEAAWAGEIPTERVGKFLLVPRARWDRKVKRLLAKARS
jgi:hypothetical protein